MLDDQLSGLGPEDAAHFAEQPQCESTEDHECEEQSVHPWALRYGQDNDNSAALLLPRDPLLRLPQAAKTPKQVLARGPDGPVSVSDEVVARANIRRHQGGDSDEYGLRDGVACPHQRGQAVLSKFEITIGLAPRES